MDRLRVFLHDREVGEVRRRERARLEFRYDPAWIEGGGPPLSLSLPVRQEPFPEEECAPFFEGLLPEGEFLRAISRQLHVSAGNAFGLLDELGGECAGAVSLAPPGADPPFDPRPPRRLDPRELARLLRELPQRPLLDDGGTVRLSLAGSQDKVGVLVEEAAIAISHGSPPTTHILKTPIQRFEDTVLNEAFCMRLAAAVGLDVAEAEPRVTEGEEYLLVRRFDRISGEGGVRRIHQEDACQAMGVSPSLKYEADGGPSVAEVAALIRRFSMAPAIDLMAFTDALIFNFVIGNHDAHGKNYSLLLDGPGAIKLAPLYDLISTSVYPGLDRKLAMRYGGESRPDYVRRRHLERLAADLDIPWPALRRRILALARRLPLEVGGLRADFADEWGERRVLAAIEELAIRRIGWLRAELT